MVTRTSTRVKYLIHKLPEVIQSQAKPGVKENGASLQRVKQEMTVGQ